jgi:hypothetical protein
MKVAWIEPVPLAVDSDVLPHAPNLPYVRKRQLFAFCPLKIVWKPPADT